MNTARIFSKLNHPINRFNYSTPVILLPSFLLDCGDMQNAHSFAFGICSLMSVLSLSMWIVGTNGRLLDLRLNRLWIFPLAIPLILYELSLYKHWSPQVFMLVTVIMFAVQLPLLILPSRINLTLNPSNCSNSSHA